MEGDRERPPRSLWAYAYQLVLPITESSLALLGILLDQEQVTAREAQRTWGGRLVVEDHMAHVLIVSDSPAQNHDVNLRLEGELERLGLAFLMTAPLAVGHDESPLVF